MPEPRPSEARTRGQARHMTKKNTAPPAAAGDRDERRAPSTCSRRAPAGGAAGERGAPGHRPSGQARGETKQSTASNAVAGEGDQRRAPSTCRRRAWAPVKTRSPAHGATEKRTVPLAAAAHGGERPAPSTCRRHCRRARLAWAPTKWS